MFDLTTKQWHERASHQAARWRATQSVNAFGRWLVGDTAGTGLLEVREDAFDEDGVEIVARGEGRESAAVDALDLDRIRDPGGGHLVGGGGRHVIVGAAPLQLDGAVAERVAAGSALESSTVPNVSFTLETASFPSDKIE